MTLATFIERLKHWTSARPARWRIADGELRTICDQCPITYVAQQEKDVHFDPGEYDDAAEVLGLDIHLADRIVWAADNTPPPHPRYEGELRKQLFAACGVKEGG